MERYGLIAGNGRFPFLVLEAARRQGIEMVVAAIKEETFPEINEKASEIHWMSVGELNKLIDTFHRAGVSKAIMAGQVKHHQIFGAAAKPDEGMLRLLNRLAQKNTDSLIGAIAAVLDEAGITLMDSTQFLTPLLAPAGLLTRRPPNPEEMANIEYGRAVARDIARLDLGQTLVVRDKAVVAIEAMEGTDATILRGASLCSGGPITIIKVSKPGQDMRFDVPVIGLTTVQTMLVAHATALAIDAGKTLLFDREELIALANQTDITIIACDEKRP
ncbi:MAG: UDP-2,3-diacylglucosamine diphosphatase LpxI [Acidobacteria bacterium]|nr:UDP-2,3-diacylglucosamine diphosphatase LpxI [Acidobacteriota bacterium]MBI3655747.1 UDP-2,3-diacylglucosamine diphosphatase LpxI [Acidobacteriota bacterium]